MSTLKAESGICSKDLNSKSSMSPLCSQKQGRADRQSCSAVHDPLFLEMYQSGNSLHLCAKNWGSLEWVSTQEAEGTNLAHLKMTWLDIQLLCWPVLETIFSRMKESQMKLINTPKGLRWSVTETLNSLMARLQFCWGLPQVLTCVSNWSLRAPLEMLG